MHRIQRIQQLAALALLIAATACGKHSHGGAADDAAPAPNPELSLIGGVNKTYISDCKPETDSTTRSYKEAIIYSDATVTDLTHYYDGTTCDEAKKRSQWTEVFNNFRSEVAPDITGWNTYVFQVQGVTEQVDTVLLSESYNQISAYGYNDWDVTTAKDVAGRKYNASGTAAYAVGDVHKHTFKLDGDTLTFARYTNGVASADQAFVYKLVP